MSKPMVLILCTGNSARSQMAEGILRHYQGDRYEVASAGTDPKPQVHPMAVQAMKEIGIDISHQRPKNLTDFLGKAAVQHVLIVCDNANAACPRVWPGAYTRTFIPFDDPAHAPGSPKQQLEVFQRVRDEISQAMMKWQPEKLA